MYSELFSPPFVVLLLILATIAFSFFIYYLIRLLFLLPGKFKQVSFKVLLTILAIIVLTGIANYVVTRPEICMTCHPYSSLSKPHQKLGCLSCHQENGFTGFTVFRLREAKMFFSIGKYSLASDELCVPNSNCLKCHNIIKKKVVGNNIRTRHIDFSNLVKCIECHENEVHAVSERGELHMKKCSYCHEADLKNKNCKRCHKNRINPKDAYIKLDMEHLGDWDYIHGLKQKELCYLCHEDNFCRKCHSSYPHDDQWKPKHGEIAKKNMLNCRSCHLLAGCKDCHRTEMPHPKDWQVNHGKKAKADWNYICKNCHTEQSCLECHEQSLMREIKNGDS